MAARFPIRAYTISVSMGNTLKLQFLYEFRMEEPLVIRQILKMAVEVSCTYHALLI